MFSYSKTNKVNTPISKCTDNISVDLTFLSDRTKENPNKLLISKIREVAKNGFDNNIDKDVLKKDLRRLKLELSYFLFSGVCERHHSDASLNYNSFIQIDIDFKYRGGDYYSKITKYKLARFPFVVMASISPSGYGVKALVKTSNYNKLKHLEASKQVVKYISKELSVDIDSFDILGASQPSFETYDSELYFNKEYIDFDIDFKELDRTEIVKTDFDVRGTDKTVFDIASRYALSVTGRGFEDGNKYLFINRFSIACNLLGLSYLETKLYVLDNYYHEDFVFEKSNAIQAVFKRYESVKGDWSYKVQELSQSFNTVLNSPLGSKLSNVIKDNNLNNLKNCIVISGTGTGKTYWISSLGKSKQKRIIVVPTVQMVMQVWKAKGYPFNATPFCSKAKGDVLNSDFIVVTYDSLHRLVSILENKGIAKEYVCYLDEFHNLTTSTSKLYKLTASNLAIDCLPKCKSWVGVTGTDIYNFHPFFKGVKKYTVNIPKIEKELTLIDAKEPLKTLCECVQKSINKGRFPLVLYNNTGHGLTTVKRVLKDVPNMAYFNSKAKENQFFRELSSNSLIHPSIKGIVSTTVIKEGNDILNNYDFDIIVHGDFHPTEIEQFANRPRRSKDISVCIIRTQKDDKKEQPKDYNFNPYRYATYLEKQCNSRILEFNSYEPHCYEDEMTLERRAYNFIHNLPIRKHRGELSIDWLNFNNEVFRNETKYINSNDKHLIEYLSRFNIVASQKLTSKEEINAYLKIELKKEKQVVKASNKKQYEEVLSKIDNVESVMKNVRSFEIDSSDMTSIEKMAHNRYIKLRDSYVPHESIIEILQDVGTSKAKFNAVVKQLVIYHLKNSEKYMDSNRRFSIVLKALYATFRNNETLSVETIKERLKRVLSIDRSFDVSKFDNDTRNDKVLKTARLFFNLNKIRKRDGANRFYEYRFEDLKFNVDFDGKFWDTHYTDDYMKMILSDVVSV